MTAVSVSFLATLLQSCCSGLRLWTQLWPGPCCVVGTPPVLASAEHQEASVGTAFVRTALLVAVQVFGEEQVDWR